MATPDVELSCLRKRHQKQLDLLAAQRADVESRLGEAVALLQDLSHDDQWRAAASEFCRRCGVTPVVQIDRVSCDCGRPVTRGDRCQLCHIELAREWARIARSSGRATR